MRLEIRVSSKLIAAKLLNTLPPEGVTVITPQDKESRDLTKTLIPVLIYFAASVSLDVLSAWIYDAIKKASGKITINRKETGIGKGEIRRVIEGIIAIDKD